jgi:ribonuclease E
MVNNIENDDNVVEEFVTEVVSEAVEVAEEIVAEAVTVAEAIVAQAEEVATEIVVEAEEEAAVVEVAAEILAEAVVEAAVVEAPVVEKIEYPTFVATDVTDIFFFAPNLPGSEDRIPTRDGRDRMEDRRPHRNNRAERGAFGQVEEEGNDGSTLRRRVRQRQGENREIQDDSGNTVVRIRTPRAPELITEPQRIKGSTRLEAKKQRRRDGRDAGRRRTVVTESEFLARREAVDRAMIVREKEDRVQIGVLEDNVLVEHYVARASEASLIGNVYLGKVQNVLPSMEAAFVDIGRGRNAVLYSGEVDWDSVETGNQPRKIENALKPGDKVLVQVTKDPVGQKGARLTSQVSLPGRYLVYVPNGSMNGISRKLPDTERTRLKRILKEVLPENVGVIVRTAAEGATEEQLTVDVQRLTQQWEEIARKVETDNAPAILHSESDLLIKIVRDVFNEDFHRMIIQGDIAKGTIESYLNQVAPELLERVSAYEGTRDAFDEYRITEQIEKALDRKVWLPSGGSLVIDRTEAMTVVDVNTGKFVGSGGNLEETVTKNNLEAAEEIVRQLRLRDIGGIIVVDFIDMVLETNRDLVHRRLIECLSRDRTKHQVAEVTSLGLVQLTRKKLGLGLLETFSEACQVCAGRGVIVHHEPVTRAGNNGESNAAEPRRRSKGRGGDKPAAPAVVAHPIPEGAKNALAQIAASTLGHTTEEHIEAESAEDVVEILDIPVVKSGRGRKARVSAENAEVILENVLEALPEPKAAGQGRGRSRRVSTANISTGEDSKSSDGDL